VAERWAAQLHIPFTTIDRLLENETFMQAMEKRIQESNSRLARYETIKKFKILKADFSQEAGELTPSLKVKRRVIFDRYKQEIESMYAAEF
jgi:long-chain acyl-CoA synthetase